MTLSYLLDTNVISEPLRPMPNENVLRRLQEHQGVVVIASIVWHELLYGCYRLASSPRRTAIEAYLYDVLAPSIPVLPYDERAAGWHAAERVRLASVGKTPPFVDGQIASIAGVNNLILVTFNVSNFEHFEGIQIEDWRE